jgi:hypothetical protein
MWGMSRCVDPTVMARSALPGSLIVTGNPVCIWPPIAPTDPNPVLPAATTTTTPERTSRSTSTQSGLWPQANHSWSYR